MTYINILQKVKAKLTDQLAKVQYAHKCLNLPGDKLKEAYIRGVELSSLLVTLEGNTCKIRFPSDRNIEGSRLDKLNLRLDLIGKRESSVVHEFDNKVKEFYQLLDDIRRLEPSSEYNLDFIGDGVNVKWGHQLNN